MADKGDSGGTKSVLIFLGLIALIGLTCFAPIYNGKPLLHSCLPDVTGPIKKDPKKPVDLILLDSGPPLDNTTSKQERGLDQLIRKSKQKNKKNKKK